MLWGEYHDSKSGWLPSNKNLYTYVRQAERFPGFLVAINFGDEPVTETFYREVGKDQKQVVQPHAIIRATTANFDSPRRAQDFEVGNEIDLRQAIYLAPSEGLVLEFVYKEEE